MGSKTTKAWAVINSKGKIEYADDFLGLMVFSTKQGARRGIYAWIESKTAVVRIVPVVIRQVRLSFKKRTLALERPRP